MSELAFNISGEPFELPPTMAAWRVRKLKPKGAPEVVYGRDGLPLFLPLDADVEDLRREARAEGRYRLDPVDEHNRVVPSAHSSYVCVHPIERAPEPPTPAPAAATSQVDTTAALIAALLESQKQHTELARMYVSQFPVLANAMAGVVRSAGDVGLTTRVPLILPAASEPNPDARSDQERDDDDESEIEDEIVEHEEVEVESAPKYSWARVGQTFAEHVGPYVGPLLAGLPGLASLLGAHGGKTKTDAVPGPGPIDPAPAVGGASAPGGPAPGVDASMAVRLQQIMAQLMPAEREFARSLLHEIPSADMPAWIGRLRSMSVPEAVAYVREMFREARAAATYAQVVPSPAQSAPASSRRAGQSASSTRSSGSMANARRPTADTTAARRPMQATPASSAALRDAGTQAHLDTIERVLSADERTAMRKHFAALSPAERSQFVATLLMLPVPDAVVAVRAQVGAHPASTTAARSGGADAAPTAATNSADEASHSRTVSRPALMGSNMPTASAAPHDVTPPAATPAEPAPTVAAGAPGAIAATSPTPTAPPSDTGSASDRNAHTHLADIENSLTTDERLCVHTTIAKLSPEGREGLLDQLLSVSVRDGAAILRDTIRAATTQPATAARHQSAAASADRQPVTSPEPDCGDVDDDDELDGGDGLDGDDELDDSDIVADADAPDASAGEATAPPHGKAETRQLPGDPVTPAITMHTELPTHDAESLAHFQAIEDALTLAEKMRAHELASRRPAAELRRWYAELVELSVPDAVAKIRTELARSATDSHSTTKGGAS